MFGFKKKVSVADKKIVDSFDEANKSFMESLSEVEKVGSYIKQLDSDLLKVETAVYALTQAVNEINTRLTKLEGELTIKGIKFKNN